MRRNEWWNLPPSGFELATQWSEAQHATAGLRRPPLSGFELATQWSEAQHATAGLRRPPVHDKKSKDQVPIKGIMKVHNIRKSDNAHLDLIYWMFYDHFSARSLLAKLG